MPLRFGLWVAEVVFAAAPLWIALFVDKIFEPAGVLALCPVSGPLTDCKPYPAGPWADLIVLVFALCVSALFSLGKFDPAGERGKAIKGGVGTFAVVGLFLSSVVFVLLGRQMLHDGIRVWVGSLVALGAVVSLVARLAGR